MNWWHIAGLCLLILAAPFIVDFATLPIDDDGCLGEGRPQTAIDVTWSEQDETLVLTHSGGDVLAPGDKRGTVALFVNITDADTGAVERITWINERVGNPPLEEGDTLTIEQSSIPFTLSAGDIVHIWWRGDPPLTPDRCHPLDNYGLWKTTISST